MNAEDFKNRTKAAAIEAIRLYKLIPPNEVSRTLGKQLLRSGTSVGANYRAACRSRSDADMISKLSVVLEEADETLFWLEVLEASGELPPELARPVWRAYDEIVAMLVRSIRTIKLRTSSQVREGDAHGEYVEMATFGETED